MRLTFRNHWSKGTIYTYLCRYRFRTTSHLKEKEVLSGTISGSIWQLTLRKCQFCLIKTFRYIFYSTLYCSGNGNSISWEHDKNTVLMVVSATFLLVYFVILKGRNKEKEKNKEKYFLFHFKSSFRSWDNQILNFHMFKSHDIIKCLSMKHETPFI